MALKWDTKQWYEKAKPAMSNNVFTVTELPKELRAEDGRTIGGYLQSLRFHGHVEKLEQVKRDSGWVAQWRFRTRGCVKSKDVMQVRLISPVSMVG